MRSTTGAALRGHLLRTAALATLALALCAGTTTVHAFHRLESTATLKRK
jgi:hypothetical protein